MPAFWFSVKRSLNCKLEPSDVHDPQATNESNLKTIQTRKTTSSSIMSGCSRSLSNLREVIHGSKRHTEKPPSSSPKSMESSDFLNTHDVVLSDTKCELKITGFGGNISRKGSSSFRETQKIRTPGPGGHDSLRRSYSCSRRIYGDSPIHGICSSKPRSSLDVDFQGSSLVCRKCHESFKNLDSFEAHHLSNHAVTELVEGASSRKVVEMICTSSWSPSEDNFVGIERVLKVHNMQLTLVHFEEHREIVKIKASKLPSRHPRCLADGNELLRFYGTVVACGLGLNGSSGLCRMERCGVCQILRYGFTENEVSGGVGIFTTSTSRRALESIQLDEDNKLARKALLLCRVIAGRVHRPVENIQEMAGDQFGFDSLAGKVGQNSQYEELYLLNPKSLLPCFVVICKS